MMKQRNASCVVHCPTVLSMVAVAIAGISVGLSVCTMVVSGWGDVALCTASTGAPATATAPFVHETSTEAPIGYTSGGVEVIGEMPGINNWVVKYSDDLYRGGYLIDERAVASLKELGVKTVVSISPSPLERSMCEDAGIELIEIPFKLPEGPTPSDVNWFLYLVDKTEGPVYVHCRGGTQKAAVLCIAYRVFSDGLSFEEAEAEFIALGGRERSLDGVSYVE